MCMILLFSFYIYWTKLTDASQTLQVSMLQPSGAKVSDLNIAESLVVCTTKS